MVWEGPQSEGGQCIGGGKGRISDQYQFLHQQGQDLKIESNRGCQEYPERDVIDIHGYGRGGQLPFRGIKGSYAYVEVGQDEEWWHQGQVQIVHELYQQGWEDGERV